MTDYIAREAAKKKHCEICMEECICYRNKSTCDELKAFDLIPAADVRPVVRGRWIDTDNYYQRWKCSVCGCHTRDARPPFCPNCGARMEES